MVIHLFLNIFRVIKSWGITKEGNAARLEKVGNAYKNVGRNIIWGNYARRRIILKWILRK
jgi:hypothetical protein